MRETPLRVAVIGCGFYAQKHLHAWRDLVEAGAHLVAVCDVNADRAKAAGAAFGVPWHVSGTEMLAADRPDLLDVVTRSDTHEALVTLAVDHGIDVVVQKPLAPDWEGCCRIARTVQAGGIAACVHENFRFQAPIRRLRRLVETGTIGEPRSAHISFRTAFDVYAAQPYLRDERRLIILDLGIHLLDLARVMLGEVARLSCETQVRDPCIAGEDTAVMLLRHRSGATSVIDCSFNAPRHMDSFPDTLIEVEGTQGVVTLRPGGLIQVKSRGVSWVEEARTPLRAWTEQPWHVTQDSVHAFNAHVLSSRLHGTPIETDIADNLNTFDLVNAAYRAAALGGSVVPLSYDPGSA